MEPAGCSPERGGVSLDSEPYSWIGVMAQWALVLLLVFLNGFFVAAEFAIVKIRATRLDALVQEGNVRARFAKSIVRNLNAYLSACQLGITLASLGLGWVGEPFVARWLQAILPKSVPEPVLHTASFVVAFSLITLLHITLGEQVPKTFAIRQAERVTLWSAAPMVLFYRVMYPFIWALNGLSNWMLRRAGIEPESGHESAHTEEEIRILLKESHQSGLIDKTELTFVDNIFEFSETHAREVMVPRTEMVCLYADVPIAENLRIALTERHTRYPVCAPDKDHIIGYVHIKDLFKAGENADIRAIVRPLLTVPDSMSISELLRLMQKKRTEMALLIDEYGGTAGLVTVEDILEEIVGEIHDEFDEARPAIEQRDERTYSVDGLLLIDDFNAYFGADVPNDTHDTIGGWIHAQVESPPRPNQTVRYGGMEFVVDEVDHMRISRISVRVLEPGVGGEARQSQAEEDSGEEWATA